MALPPECMEEAQYRTKNSSRRNRKMVYRRQTIRGMENIVQSSIVDLRKAYVAPTLKLHLLRQMTCRSGIREDCILVR